MGVSLPDPVVAVVPVVGAVVPGAVVAVVPVVGAGSPAPPSAGDWPSRRAPNPIDRSWAASSC